MPRISLLLRRRTIAVAALLALAPAAVPVSVLAQRSSATRAAASPARVPFTLEQVMSATYPTNLTAARSGERIAWTLNASGQRNIWVAEGPTFTPRRLTEYLQDDAQ